MVDVQRVLENLDKAVENLGLTDDGGRPITKLTPYQKKIVEAILKREHRRYCILASTQVGKSTAVMVAALLSAMIYDGEEVWIVSPSYKQAVGKFEYIRRAVENRLRPFVDFTKPFRRDSVYFLNGSVIRCLSAGARQSLLGFSATMLIVDEAQEIPDEIWRTRLLRMVVGSGMKQAPVVVLIGTANRINFLRDAFMSDDWWKMKVTWRDGIEAGILRQEIVDYARRNLSESEFRAWFEAEFETPAGKLFNLAKMKELMTIKRSIVEIEDRANWMIFGGLDVARFGEDESCLVLIRVPANFEWGEAPADMMFYETKVKRSAVEIFNWVSKKIEKYGVDQLAVDETAMGGPIVDVLREKFGYGRIVGVRLIGREREEVYGALVEAIENGWIRLLADNEILRQAEKFSVEQSTDGRTRILKQKGARDDIIDALALAVYVARRSRSGRVGILSEVNQYFGRL